MKNTKITKSKVMTVASWFRAGHFDNDDEAQGAFKLARQQFLDGLGDNSCAEWMGLTEAELDAWMRDDLLPPKKRARRRSPSTR